MISVILPVYNTQKYLDKCITSILKQTYLELELIIVDDGSTDNSYDICERYLADDRVQLIHVENGGQGKARNIALDRCKGEYISFVDSDDWILPDMYEDMLASMEKCGADMAICGIIRDHSFAQKVMPMPPGETIYDGDDLFRTYLGTPFITSSVANKIYRKELWENVRFPESRAREDAGILYKIFKGVKKAVHIGTGKYVQYVRRGSTEREAGGFNRSKLFSLEVSRAKMTYVREHYSTMSEIVKFDYAKTCQNLMADIIQTFSLKQNKDIYNDLLISFKEELYEISKNDFELDDEYLILEYTAKHPKRFKFKNYIIGVKNIIVDQVQYIYERFCG